MLQIHIYIKLNRDIVSTNCLFTATETLYTAHKLYIFYYLDKMYTLCTKILIKRKQPYNLTFIVHQTPLTHLVILGWRWCRLHTAVSTCLIRKINTLCVRVYNIVWTLLFFFYIACALFVGSMVDNVAAACFCFTYSTWGRIACALYSAIVPSALSLSIGALHEIYSRKKKHNIVRVQSLSGATVRPESTHTQHAPHTFM